MRTFGSAITMVCMVVALALIEAPANMIIMVGGMSLAYLLGFMEGKG